MSDGFESLDGRQHADEILRSLLYAAPDAVVVVDGSGRIVFVNQQTEQLFGYPRGELLGQAIEVLIPARLRASHVHHRDAFTKAPRVRAMRSRLPLFGKKRDGTEFPVEISLKRW